MITRSRGALFALAALGCAISIAGAALAEGGGRVLLIAPSSDHPLVFRLRRELELVGVEVDVLVDPRAEERDLAATARERRAAATVVIEPSPPAIVLQPDPAQGAAALPIRIDAGAADLRLPVLRAVETVRERLLAPPPAPPPPTPSLPAPPPPPTPSLPDPHTHGPSGFAGVAGLLSAGGVSATPHVWIGARWAPIHRLDIELVGLLPTAAASVSAAEGTTKLRPGAVAAGVSARLGDPDHGLFAGAGGGLGVMITGYEGEAAAPYRSASGISASMMPYLHLAGGYWITAHFALRADVLTVFTIPEPVVTIAGRREAVFAEPGFALALGVEVRP